MDAVISTALTRQRAVGGLAVEGVKSGTLAVWKNGVREGLQYATSEGFVDELEDKVAELPTSCVEAVRPRGAAFATG